ncbi:MAG: hypothetical protein QOH71_48 [Blastocatellia bacterium]|jgi:hypothetical protein|nr:hypothetical protein [Blastocatellia bacterium]
MRVGEADAIPVAHSATCGYDKPNRHGYPAKSGDIMRAKPERK